MAGVFFKIRHTSETCVPRGINAMLPKGNMPAVTKSVKMRTDFVLAEKR